MRRRVGRAPVLAAAIAAFACTRGAASGGGSSAPGATPTPATVGGGSGARVEMPSGTVYRLELALTPEEQALGLMYRESLAPDSGMLFLFETADTHHFWMKNTMIPLDMIWTDAAGKVVYVSADTPPCKADPCATYGPDTPASQVLEIAGGWAAREKVTVGSTLKFSGLPR